MKIVFSSVPKDFKWQEDLLYSLTWAMSEYFDLETIESETRNLVLGGYGQEIHVKVVGMSTATPPSMLRNVALKIFWFLKSHGLVESADVCFMGFGREGFFLEADFPELTKKVSPLQS